MQGGGIIGFAVAAVIACCAVPTMSAVAIALGAVAVPSPRGVHTGIVPLSGGLCVIVAVAVALAVTRGPAPPWIVAGVLGMAAIGLVDDVLELRWMYKLGLEIAVIALALWIDGHALGVPRLAWLLLVTNAFNVIDNMDGLATGTSVLVLGALSLVAVRCGAPAVGYLALVVAGGAVGFFGPNFARGAAFLGDCGALVLGFVAAAISISIADSGGNLVACALPLAYPVGDVAFVVVARCLRGMHPATGGTDHTSHRLAARVASPQRAVAILMGVSLVSGIAAGLLA